MADKEKDERKSIGSGLNSLGFSIFASLMFIFFGNEPDLADALIQFLMSHCIR